MDAYSNFWIVGWGGPLVRIDANTLEVTRWDPPSESFPYGIALDAGGHPWLSGLRGKLVHFDPERETFETMVENLPGEADIGGATVRIFRGLQIDRRNRAWLAANAPCGLVQVDLADGTVFDDIALTDCVEPVGVAIDPEGFIWTPDRGAGVAYRVDPMDLQLRITPGLVDPYTYSDMTGAGLHLVVSGYEP